MSTSVQTSTKVKWLEQRLRIDRDGAVRILKANPSLFGANADNSLYPKLVWLQEGLGLAAVDVAPVVCACPNILRYLRL